MFVADTNIFVHAALRSSPEHERAAGAVAEWRSGDTPWFVTWPILYEFLRVVTHPAVAERPLSPPHAFDFVNALLATPSLGLLVESPRHEEVLARVLEECPWARGSAMHDLHTVVLMREHGLREIRTADSGFLRFRSLEVVDPLDH